MSYDICLYFSDLNPFETEQCSHNPSIPSIESIRPGINFEELVAPSQVNSKQTPSVELCVDSDEQVVGKRKLTSIVWSHFKKQKIDGV